MKSHVSIASGEAMDDATNFRELMAYSAQDLRSALGFSWKKMLCPCVLPSLHSFQSYKKLLFCLFGFQKTKKTEDKKDMNVAPIAGNMYRFWGLGILEKFWSDLAELSKRKLGVPESLGLKGLRVLNWQNVFGEIFEVVKCDG